MCCDDTDLRRRVNILSSSYPTDLDKSLGDELIQFRAFVSTEPDKTPANRLQVVLKHTDNIPQDFSHTACNQLRG